MIFLGLRMFSYRPGIADTLEELDKYLLNRLTRRYITEGNEILWVRVVRLEESQHALE